LLEVIKNNTNIYYPYVVYFWVSYTNTIALKLKMY